MLNVGAGRDCGKLGENVLSMDVRIGSDDYTKLALWKEPILPDYVHDANELFPFDDGIFDCVMSMHLLEHMDSLSQTLDEMFRVTKQDGIVCGILPCAAHNPHYNYWRDPTHIWAYSRYDFDKVILMSYIQRNNVLIQYDSMNRRINPWSFDFAVRKGGRSRCLK